jgi:malate dehydrogenase (oxaloacetate-decarboxylating)(NADP+)
MVKRKEADAMICGATGRYTEHLPHLFKIIGLKQNVSRAAAMCMLIMPKGTYFWLDPYVNPGPSAEQIADMTILAAQNIRRFGIVPKAGLLSHSNFGSSNRPTARKMREALALIRKLDPSLQVDGEMHADTALSEELRDKLIEDSPLKGAANLLVMPSLDSANISYNLVRVLADGLAVGPMLLGMNQPAHILAEGVTARGIMNLTAIAVVEAQTETDGELPL